MAFSQDLTGRCIKLSANFTQHLLTMLGTTPELSPFKTIFPFLLAKASCATMRCNK
jgi:hypothetical protein